MNCVRCAVIHFHPDLVTRVVSPSGLRPSLYRSSQSTDNSRGGKVRNTYRKIKTNSHKNLSPASVDKSVHKTARPLKYRPFCYL